MSHLLMERVKNTTRVFRVRINQDVHGVRAVRNV